MIGFGSRTEPVSRFMLIICATETHTLWIRKSLSHSLLVRKDAAPTIYRYRDRSLSLPHGCEKNLQPCRETRKLRTPTDQADVCPEHALQIFREQVDGLDDGLA